MENVAISKIFPLNNLTTSTARFSNTIKIMADAKFITPDVMASLRESIRKYLAEKPKVFSGEFSLSIRDFQPPYQCWLYLFVEHSYPVYPVTRWKQDQSHLLTHVISKLKESGVSYYSTTVPVASGV